VSAANRDALAHAKPRSREEKKLNHEKHESHEKSRHSAHSEAESQNLPLSRLRERGRGEGDGGVRYQRSDVRGQRRRGAIYRALFGLTRSREKRLNHEKHESHEKSRHSARREAESQNLPLSRLGERGRGEGDGGVRYQRSEVRGQRRRGAIYRALFVFTRSRKEKFPSPASGRGVGERVRQTPARLRRAPPFKRGLFFFAASRLRVRLFPDGASLIRATHCLYSREAAKKNLTTKSTKETKNTKTQTPSPACGGRLGWGCQRSAA